MEYIADFANSFQSSGEGAVSNFSAVFKNADLSPRVQRHLVRVYQLLALTLLTTAVGVVADINLRLGGTLSAVAGVLVLIALGMQSGAALSQRVGLLALYGFLQGCSIGPLVRLAIAVDPAILFTAIAGTAGVFVCFSLSALFSARRSYMYLGGMLSSALSFLVVLSLVSLVWRPVFAHSISLYFGLAVFCAFVLYDTQLIVEKADNGSDDVVAHALELFMDFIAIFVRLLIILIQNSQEKKEKKKTRR